MTILGKYELLESLGSGATSEVFRARDTVLERDVAVKILKPALVTDPASFNRFVQEARSTASLFHDHIATVLDAGETDGRYYLVMRYFAGLSLEKILRESGPLSWQQVLELARQVGAALDYAHQQGLLHRDVKPSNILVTPAGQYVLTDFGLVRAMMSTGLTSHTGTVLGTPSYIAPEIWKGEPASPASDQYSLACVLVEALTGKVLFTGETPPVIMYSHLEKGVHLLENLPVNVPIQAAAALRKALAQDPTQRFLSCGALAQALSQPERMGKLSAEPSISNPSPHGTVSEKKRGHWLIPGVIAAAVVILLLVVSQLAKLTASQPEPTVSLPTLTAVPAQVTNPLPTVTVLPSTTTLEPATPTVPLPTTSSPTLTAQAMILPDCTKIGQSWTSPVDSMTLMCVPAGTFLMGAAESDTGAMAGERPQHTVTLDAFWIDRTEVTNSQYSTCVQAKACIAPYSNSSTTHLKYYGTLMYASYPVIWVDWEDAVKYCTWAGRRLPTEAQWEKAAHGTDGRPYPWGDTAPYNQLANFADNEGDTTAVGSYPTGASPYGALDMAGNVWEWVADWYDANYYSASPLQNPTGPSSGSARVRRGGSLGSTANGVKTVDRYNGDPINSDRAGGFRCVR